MRRHRKRGKKKLIASLVLLAVMLAALLVLLPGRMPEEGVQKAELIPVGGGGGRKNIYDRNLRELAVSLKLTSVYARPLELREPEMIADRLSTILERDEKELLNVLGSERSFVWLARRLEAEKSARVLEMKTEGLYFFDEEQRFYPNRETAAHVLGFLSNEQGLAGVEFYYEQILQFGWDKKILPNLVQPVDTENGAHLVLTLDLPVQVFIERELAKLKKDTGAAAAMALVMEPSSGQVNALVNLPGFDPNLFWRSNTTAHRNRILTDPLFPDGLLKLFRLAAVSETEYEIPENQAAPVITIRPSAKIKGRPETPGVLHGDWAESEQGVHATPSLARLPEPSLSREEFAQFVRDIGLYADLEIDLPRPSENGEAWRKSGLAGDQTITGPLTGLQLLTGFSRLVSSGSTGPPHLLKAILTEEGPVQLAYEKKPPVVSEVARQAVLSILSPDAAAGSRLPGMAESLFSLRPTSGAAGEESIGQCRTQNILLGITPGPLPLVFLLVLDDACIDPGRPSQLRGLGRRFASRLDGLRQEKEGAGGKSDEQIYQSWLDLHQPREQSSPKPPLREERMPDVRGYGLRQALQVLQTHGIHLEITGSGRVVGQQPGPGKSLAGVREIKLELRHDHE
jgi:cell division protein FtsI (penicillin-binding protein 3)